MSCIHNHYAPGRLAQLATDAGWSADDVAGLLAFCIGHERAGERGPCPAVAIAWTEAFELASGVAAGAAPTSATRCAEAAALLAEFGEYRDGNESSPPRDAARELMENSVELARELYADGVSEGGVAAELARLGIPAEAAHIAAAVAATDRLADVQ